MLSPGSRCQPRRADRGQALVVIALMLIVIVGSAAIAVDLGAQSKSHRALLNWTDAAAIAGARNCSTACNAKTEVQDAIQLVLQNSPWSSVTTWATGAPTGSCMSNSCVVSKYKGPPGFTSYQVSVSSPPANPQNASYSSSTQYVEVDITQDQNTSFSYLVGGASTTRSTGHSIAYDAGPQAPYQFTFFSKIETDSGNQVQKLEGDVYVGDGYNDQSNGQAGLCVLEVPEPNPDNDSEGGGGLDDDLDNQGHVVFGVLPPPTVGLEPLYSHASCPSSGGGGSLYVQQPSPSAGAGCPTSTTPKQDGSNGTWVCYLPPPGVPPIPSPTPTPGAPFSNFCGTIDANSATLFPGVYEVAANCPQVKLDFNNGNINCVSLVLPPGGVTQVLFDNKKNTPPSGQYITAYGYSASDTIANQAITNIKQTPTGSNCPGHAANNDRSVIWAPDPGSLNTLQPVLKNGQTGCCSDTLFVGTIFVPNQEISFTTNQSMEDVGSVYCGNWLGQAGNHPNPTVTYDTVVTTFLPSALRLVE